jgi:hypothetical protein
VLFDDNSISIDGGTDLATSEDPLKRFAGYGWATKRIDGHDFEQLQAALAFALKSSKPTMIACRPLSAGRADQGRHRRQPWLGFGRRGGSGETGAGLGPSAVYCAGGCPPRGAPPGPGRHRAPRLAEAAGQTSAKARSSSV